jgi:hypothetical protein
MIKVGTVVREIILARVPTIDHHVVLTHEKKTNKRIYVQRKSP